MCCISSNMDIKFIGSGRECRSLAFYITDYQTKSQLTSHNTLPFVAATMKNYELGAGNDSSTDAITKSKQMALKCLNRLSTEIEMSASHVASLLLGYNDKYTSHTFRPLNLYNFLPSLKIQKQQQDEKDAEDDNDLIQWGNDGNLVLLNTKGHYLYRGHDLKSMCLYDYVATVDKAESNYQIRSTVPYASCTYYWHCKMWKAT